MPKQKFFMICYGIILVLIIMWLLTRVDFLFQSIVAIVEILFLIIRTLIVPFLLAGVLYYLFRPLVDFLAQKGLHRVVAILTMYLTFIGMITVIVLAAGPLLQAQVQRLIDNAPLFADLLLEQWEYIQGNRDNLPDFVDEGIQAATQATQDFLNNIGEHLAALGKNILSILSSITSFLITLIIIPFILFYMLKDGKHLSNGILKFIPNKRRQEAELILSDMNKALNTYVMGQVIVSVFVGVMVFIGYSIIGLEYSLILALVAMLTNLIPFIGPFIGTFPAVIVGLIESPGMMFQVLLVVIVVQQIESNLISPQVMGRVLDLHPLTIILLILVAGSIFGLVGLLLAVPVYAVGKVVVKHAKRLIELRKIE